MLKSTVLHALGYFFAVFVVGFLLGVIRELWLLQWMTQRNSELLEMPFMLFVSYLAAKYIVIRRSHSRQGDWFLLIGFVALIIMLGFELTVVLGLRGLTFSTYIESRDIIAGSAYLVSLLLFMLMPWIIYIKQS